MASNTLLQAGEDCVRSLRDRVHSFATA